VTVRHLGAGVYRAVELARLPAATRPTCLCSDERAGNREIQHHSAVATAAGRGEGEV